MATFADSNNIAMISPDLIRSADRGNPQYEKTNKYDTARLPKTCSLIMPEIHEYCEVRHRLTSNNGLVLLDWRIDIPKMQRRKSCTTYILYTKN